MLPRFPASPLPGPVGRGPSRSPRRTAWWRCLRDAELDRSTPGDRARTFVAGGARSGVLLTRSAAAVEGSPHSEADHAANTKKRTSSTSQ